MAIDSYFKEIIKSKTGCAVIMAGSGSDEPHIIKILKSLDDYEIPHRVMICSAHKQPEKLMGIIEELNQLDGSLVYIAVAGGTDALSGTLSYHSVYPVISCPPDGLNQSCLTNPPGSSNAYILKPKNVGKFVAQIYSGMNPTLKELILSKNQNKVDKLNKQDIELSQRYNFDS